MASSGERCYPTSTRSFPCPSSCHSGRLINELLNHNLFLHQPLNFLDKRTRPSARHIRLIPIEMPPSLLRPQGHISPAEALLLAQQAPTILRQNPKAVSASPLSSLFSAPETADLWLIYENLLLSCLRTGDDESAHKCLESLVLRFGETNERIMALQGLVKEAEAANHNELLVVLKEYEEILQENPANIVRRAQRHEAPN